MIFLINQFTPLYWHYHRLVQYTGSHADEAVIFYPTAVKQGTVADGDKVSDMAFVAFSVDYRIILYIGIVTDGDGLVAPDRGMVPDT